MSKSVVSQPEINYIFKSSRIGLYDRWSFEPVPDPGNIQVPENLRRALNRHPALALASCWKFREGRAGLSPFVMHYLLKDTRPIKEFIDYIKRFDNKLYSYHYCGTTYLPVANSLVQRNWGTQNSFKMYKPARRIVGDWFDRDWERRARARRDEAELDGIIRYEWALASNDPDEAMRTFKGSHIKADMWRHLKGVAGIYL